MTTSTPQRSSGTTQGPSGPKRGRGRPRDPELVARAQRACLDIFCERGWNGLTLDEVATRAHVGKSSLYLRWSDKADLLASALRGIQEETAEADEEAGAPEAPSAEATAGPGDLPCAEGAASLTLRDYLVAHAQRRADLYLGEHGLAMLRLYAEARAHPELFVQIRDEAMTRFVRLERKRVQAAITAGDLPPTASPTRILDAVEGAVLMHILVTPPDLVGRMRTGLTGYIEQMVDDQLRAAGFSPRGS